MQVRCSVRTMERHVVDELVPDEPAAVRLMDTVLADRAGVRDALTSRAELVAFLSGLAGAAPHRVTADDLAAARHLRDALRRLAADVPGDDRAEGHSAMSVAAATAAVNDAVRGRPAPVLRRARGAWHFEPVDRSVRALLGGLAAEGA